ncbi:hypothetical protein HanRHA438_Chr16g0748751 [Helianthus annuus]|nr:hypothetical protein HanRHA438_Chr16g0748751 [Helianthus annuus]
MFIGEETTTVIKAVSPSVRRSVASTAAAVSGGAAASPSPIPSLSLYLVSPVLSFGLADLWRVGVGVTGKKEPGCGSDRRTEWLERERGNKKVAGCLW